MTAIPASLDVQLQPLVDLATGYSHLKMFSPEWMYCRDSLADFGVDFNDTVTVIAILDIGTASRLHHPAPPSAMRVLAGAVGV